MKTSTILMLFLMLTSFSIQKEEHNKTIYISPQSKLEIIGSSNVNNFKCVFNVKNLNKPLKILYEKEDEVIRFKKSTLILDNSFFNCGGKGINRDFHGLLKTDEHPQILLSLKEIKKKTYIGNKVEALVEIQIAGVSQTYIVDVEANRKDDLQIEGRLKLNITDFNLEAPKKMMGLIVVSEEIEILFNLFLEDSHKSINWD